MSLRLLPLHYAGCSRTSRSETSAVGSPRCTRKALREQAFEMGGQVIWAAKLCEPVPSPYGHATVVQMVHAILIVDVSHKLKAEAEPEESAHLKLEVVVL